VLGISYHTLQAYLRVPLSPRDEASGPVKDIDDGNGMAYGVELTTEPIGCSETVEVDV